MKIDRHRQGAVYRRSGYFAELLARWFYRLHGWQILHQNYITGKGTTAGEIDFIACRGQQLAFVEVKKRSSIDLAAYAVSNRQKRRIANAARCFIQTHPRFRSYRIQFDAVLIKFPLTIRRESQAWFDNFY